MKKILSGFIFAGSMVFAHHALAADSCSASGALWPLYGASAIGAPGDTFSALNDADEASGRSAASNAIIATTANGQAEDVIIDGAQGSNAVNINNAGEAFGLTAVGPRYLWRQGQKTAIALSLPSDVFPYGFEIVAFSPSLNERGQVLGSACGEIPLGPPCSMRPGSGALFSWSSDIGFAWQNGKTQVLTGIRYPMASNSFGDVVGMATDGSIAIRYANGTLKPLVYPAPAGSVSSLRPFAINDQRQVAGMYGTMSATALEIGLFFLDNGKFTVIKSLRSNRTSSFTPSVSSIEGYIYDSSFNVALNNSGMVAASAKRSARIALEFGTFQPLVWQCDRGLVDIDSLVVQGFPKRLTVYEATVINDAGHLLVRANLLASNVTFPLLLKDLTSCQNLGWVGAE